jgi:hypothetical protein
VRFEVTVDAVEESVLPEVDAAFIEAFGIEDGDVARFREDVRKNMEREMKQRLDSRRKEAVMNLLLEVHDIELPQVLVQGEIRAMNDQMRETLGTKDLSLPDGLFDEALGVASRSGSSSARSSRSRACGPIRRGSEPRSRKVPRPTNIPRPSSSISTPTPSVWSRSRVWSWRSRLSPGSWSRSRWKRRS